jgi:predicted amidohydrolase
MTVRIAVAQFETIPDDVRGNRAKAMSLAGEGLLQAADIVLLHEGMLTGYGARFKELAEPPNGPTAAAFRALLQGSTTRVLFGLVERQDDAFTRRPCWSGPTESSRTTERPICGGRPRGPAMSERT